MTTLARQARHRAYVANSLSSVRSAVGPIEPGCEIFTLSKGQFSLPEVLQHVLDHTGPARVDIVTWSLALLTIDDVGALVADGTITALRWVLDWSWPARQPDRYRALLEAFDREDIRVSRCHAKFLIVRNDAWSVVIRGSANMNKNPRVEIIEISDDAALADLLAEFVDEVFACGSPADLGVGHRPAYRGFDQLELRDDAEAEREPEPDETDLMFRDLDHLFAALDHVDL